ncbi:MAG: hypothetical protein ACK4TC_11325 [Sphingomonas pseudosanguinis]|uniref:hypothetical protein n=1 Tax=Sphingomonas pseudosanguinis TaxID=413712 RepID=UPI00391C0871
MSADETPREASARIVARYADPAHCPEWTGEGDVPPWNTASASDKQRFEAFVNSALNWLEREVRRVRVAEIDELGAVGHAAPLLAKALDGAGPALTRRIAAMRAIQPRLTATDIIKKERRAETGQLETTGPTASTDGEKARTPTARAAQDVDWMRRAIFPRFWPGHERRTLPPYAEDIAARRRDTTAKAIKSWRENSKPR